MSLEFFADSEPSQQLQKEVSNLMPENPFYTSSYTDFQRKLGLQPWIFSLCHEGNLVSGCTAFIKSGYLTRALYIPSLPAVPEGKIFWKGIEQFCQRLGVSYLGVDSYASNTISIPELSGEAKRRSRWEYVLELQQPNLWGRLSSNHLRNIKRANKSGVQIRRSTEPQAREEHMRLIGVSMGRRKRRGESIEVYSQERSYKVLAENGGGEFFQAIQGGKVLSSIFILMSDRSGYYQSAGTSSEGMACGASHFLVQEIANTLREQSKTIFNLGGADPSNPGLVRFKTGFGGRTVKLEAAEFYLGSKARKTILTGIRYLRDIQLYLFRYLPGRA